MLTCLFRWATREKNGKIVSELYNMILVIKNLKKNGLKKEINRVK